MLKKTATQALHVAKLIYTPLSFVCIIYFVLINKVLLAKMISVSDIMLLLYSVLVWCTLHLISPFLTKNILLLLNHKLSYAQILDIYITRLPARYLPGGIWHTVGRFSDYHKHGITKTQLTLLAVIETILPAIITFCIGGGYLWISGTTSLLHSLEGILALGSLCLLLTGPVLLKLNPPQGYEKNNYLIYCSLVIVSGLFWIVASISFILYYSSLLSQAADTPFLTIAATYIFSWGIGYISIFAPQGIGIFEFVAGKLLVLPMNLGGAIAFIAGFRVVVLVADCFSWGIYKLSQIYIFKSFPSHPLNSQKKME